MKVLQIYVVLLIATAFSGQARATHTLDDSVAFSGLTSTRAIYDVHAADEKTLLFIFTAIRDTQDETVKQQVNPRFNSQHAWPDGEGAADMASAAPSPVFGRQ